MQLINCGQDHLYLYYKYVKNIVFISLYNSYNCLSYFFFKNSFKLIDADVLPTHFPIIIYMSIFSPVHLHMFSIVRVRVVLFPQTNKSAGLHVI